MLINIEAIKQIGIDLGSLVIIAPQIEHFIEVFLKPVIEKLIAKTPSEYEKIKKYIPYVSVFISAFYTFGFRTDFLFDFGIATHESFMGKALSALTISAVTVFWHEIRKKEHEKRKLYEEKSSLV